jgi:hypothetical protein
LPHHDAQGVTGSSPVRPTRKYLVRAVPGGPKAAPRSRDSSVWPRRTGCLPGPSRRTEAFNPGGVIDVPLAWVELIVALDYSRWFSLQRLVRRTVIRVVGRRPICNGNRETWRGTFARDSIIVWHFRSFTRKRQRIREWCSDPARPPVVRLTSRRQTNAWLRALGLPLISGLAPPASLWSPTNPEGVAPNSGVPIAKPTSATRTEGIEPQLGEDLRAQSVPTHESPRPGPGLTADAFESIG